MRKHALLISVFVAIAVAFMFSVGIASDPADTMTMNSKIYKKHKKGLVTFTHKKHSEELKVACNECHHVYEGGKNKWKKGDAVKKCGECHTDTGKPEKGMSKKDKIAKFHKEALHANCKDACHKAEAKKGKNAPTKCKECHPQKAK
jgi:hypothetical protein